MKYLFFILTLFAVNVTYALDVPELSSHVTDQAHVLSPDEIASLEHRLVEYGYKTGHQFAVLTVPTLAGESVEGYADQVFKAWKLGDAKRDDGLLFLLATGERKMRIEVGYGLEGAVTDLEAKRALDEIAKPSFKRGNYAEGFNNVFDKLETLAAPEAVKPVAAKSKSSNGGTLLAWFLGTLGAVIGLVVYWFRKAEKERIAEYKRQEEQWAAESAKNLAESRRAQRGAKSYDFDGLVNKAHTYEPAPSSSVYTPTPKAPVKPTTKKPKSSTTASIAAVNAYDEEERRRKRRREEEDNNSSSSSFDSGPSWGGGNDSGGDFGGGGGSSGGGGASGDY